MHMIGNFSIFLLQFHDCDVQYVVMAGMDGVESSRLQKGNSRMPSLTLLIAIAVIVVVVIVLMCMGYVSAKSNECIVITGLGKPRWLIGRSGFMVPFLEKRNKLELEQFNIDVQTSDFVPTEDFINVKADAAVKAKIGITPEMLHAASQNFLNWHTDRISLSIRDILEGNLREIIGKMELRKMVQDRQSFAEQVQENAAPDLAKMGLEIVAFTVQKFTDTGGVIENLGIDNIVTIQKDATNARARAEREMAEVKAREAQASNEAQVKAELEIAERKNELAKRQSELQAEASVKKAQAEAAYQIEQENQRKTVEMATADANLIKQRKEAEVKEAEVKVKEQELDATVRKQADAEKYRREKEAEAARIERERQSDAELYEAKQDAEKTKAEAMAHAEAMEREAQAKAEAAKKEAEGISARGRAEAEAIAAKLTAEAEGLNKKADAMKKFGQAAVIQMVVEKLPEIAKSVSEPLSKVGSITMYGDGNGSKMVGDVMTSMNQISSGLGINVPDLIKATLTGRAMGNSMAGSIETEDSDPVKGNETVATKEPSTVDNVTVIPPSVHKDWKQQPKDAEQSTEADE